MTQVVPLRQTAETPAPPEHLSPGSRARWRGILEDWELEVESLMLLQAALECWDEYQTAREIVAREGPTVTNVDSGMVRQHPAALVGRDALKGFRMAMKDLGLKEDGQ